MGNRGAGVGGEEAEEAGAGTAAGDDGAGAAGDAGVQVGAGRGRREVAPDRGGSGAATAADLSAPRAAGLDGAAGRDGADVAAAAPAPAIPVAPEPPVPHTDRIAPTAAPPGARAPASSANAAALSRWLTPRTMRSQFILTEVLQPPLALREPQP